MYVWQHGQAVLKVHSDADWAGCKETRKSITGGCIQIGSHTIKGWSKTQSLIVLSSGESELYAILKVAAEGLGISVVLSDFGWRMEGQVWGDASAALGIIHRKGLGKTRHIDTGYVWAQEVAAKEGLKFRKALGKDNPADFYTKHLDEKTSGHHTKTLAFKFKDGSAEEAPQFHGLSGSRDEHGDGGSVSECEWAKIATLMVNHMLEQKQWCDNSNTRGDKWLAYHAAHKTGTIIGERGRTSKRE